MKKSSSFQQLVLEQLDIYIAQSNESVYGLHTLHKN